MFFLSLQIPVERTSNIPLPPHHGYYLFIVTPSPTFLPSPPLLSSSSPAPRGHRLVRVYLKPLFSREAVSLLSSPGQRLLIRDVELNKDKGQYNYSVQMMNTFGPAILSFLERLSSLRRIECTVIIEKGPQSVSLIQRFFLLCCFVKC